MSGRDDRGLRRFRVGRVGVVQGQRGRQTARSRKEKREPLGDFRYARQRAGMVRRPLARIRRLSCDRSDGRDAKRIDRFLVGARRLFRRLRSILSNDVPKLPRSVAGAYFRFRGSFRFKSSINGDRGGDKPRNWRALFFRQNAARRVDFLRRVGYNGSVERVSLRRSAVRRCLSLFFPPSVCRRESKLCRRSIVPPNH